MKKVSIGKHISSIYRYQSIIVNQLFQNFGFGSGQYLILIRIAENPGINQKALSEMLQIDRANINRGIKKLESLGYISVTPDESDRRNQRATLTEQGELIIEEVFKKLSCVTKILTQDLSEDEVLLLNKLLIHLENNVQKEVEELRKGKHYDD